MPTSVPAQSESFDDDDSKNWQSVTADTAVLSHFPVLNMSKVRDYRQGSINRLLTVSSSSRNQLSEMMFLQMFRISIFPQFPSFGNRSFDVSLNIYIC